MTEKIPAAVVVVVRGGARATPRAGRRTGGGTRREAADLQPGDYIVAIVNSELVTAGEVQLRLTRVAWDAARNKSRLPPEDELRKQIVDALIDERVQVTTPARTGIKIDDADLNRAIGNIALQNQMTVDQLRALLRAEGIDYGRFRDNIRDQIAVERVRDREVGGRIQITDLEIDNLLDKHARRPASRRSTTLPRSWSPCPKARPRTWSRRDALDAETALARVNAGEPFAQVAREMSEDGNRANGGEIGMRPADLVADVFVEVVRPLTGRAVAPTLRTGAGFHVIKARRQTRRGQLQRHPDPRAAHPAALLAAGPAGGVAAAPGHAQGDILSGRITFEQAARDNSEDSSAAQVATSAGPRRACSSPSSRLRSSRCPTARFPIRSCRGSAPTWHRCSKRRTVTLDPKQQREQLRNVLREQRYEEAYNDWSRDLRARAYVEMREAPY